MPDAEGKRRLALGTAGHVDHGKSALIAALTGIGMDRLDRLAEERRRGITIELGYADLELNDGRRLSVIDVPGHERLVRTMVSGATGIDLFLMVVAADDGVMPQTVEHAAVMHALGLSRGVAAISKSDLSDDAKLSRVEAEVRSLFPTLPIVRTSVTAPFGLDELRGRLASVADAVDAVDAGKATGPPVLHVDRVFSLPGAGTVATGTLRCGTLETGQRLQVLPRGTRARVRSLEVHGEPVERAGPRRRVAAALSGVRRDDVRRGDVLAAPEARLAASYRLDVDLGSASAAAGLDRTRLEVHAGTRHAPARLVALGDGLAQLRLEAPLIAMAGDRVVLRAIAPPDTVGGATVLDPAPRRHGPGAATERLLAVRDGRPPPAEEARRPRPERRPAPQVGPVELAVLALLDSYGDAPPSSALLAERLRSDRARVDTALIRLVEAGRVTRVAKDVYYPSERLAGLSERVVALAADSGALSLAQVRDRLGTSRKYAQALLEHLDSAGVTVRHGDVHVVRRRG